MQLSLQVLVEASYCLVAKEMMSCHYMNQKKALLQF